MGIRFPITFSYNQILLKILVYLVLIFTAVLSTAHNSMAQRQLLVLKYNEVVARFSPGQEFEYKHKESHKKISTYIRGLSETEVYTHNDTVSIFEIGTIFFHQHSVHHTIGKALLIGGIGGFLIDQVNNVLFYGNKPSLDGEINRVSMTAIGAGLPLTQIKKDSRRMDYKFKPLIVTQDSYLYHKGIAR